jgi:hypothetical protein
VESLQVANPEWSSYIKLRPEIMILLSGRDEEVRTPPKRRAACRASSEADSAGVTLAHGVRAVVAERAHGPVTLATATH